MNRIRVICLIIAGMFILAGETLSFGDAIYSVNDLGTSNPSILSNQAYIPDDINTESRLSIDASGSISSGRWSNPSTYTGVLPPALANGAYGPDVVVLSQAGDNLAGWGFDQSRAWRGFASIGGQVYDLGFLPGMNWSQAYGVNKAGEAVGSSGASAFLFRTGQGLTPIGPNGSFSSAYAINNSGLIVGESTRIGTSDSRAFISDDGKSSTDLNRLISPTAGYKLVNATGINDAGQIAAFGKDSSGVFHSLLLTPEPGVDLGQIRSAIDGSTPPTSGGGPTPGNPTTTPEPGPLAIFSLVVFLLGCRAIRCQACPGGRIFSTRPSASRA